MPEEYLVQRVLDLVKEYGVDGLVGCEVGNSVIGSLLSLKPPIGLGSPRQYTEAACREARRRLEDRA